MDLTIYEAFREAGIDEKPAKNITEAINKAIEQNYAISSQQLATKGDVEYVRLEIEKVRAEIAQVEARIIKWNVGAIIAAAGLAMAIARLFFTAS